MKHSKKFLKGVFGDAQEGFDYLSKVRSNQKAAVLIVDGAGSHAFADWVGSLQGNPSSCSLTDLIDGNAPTGSGLTIIKENNDDLPDPGIRAALSSRNAGQNIIIAMPSRPRSIAFVRDPALLSIPVEELPGDVLDESNDLISELS